MIREELSRLFTIGERHRRLFARLVLAFGLSIVVLAVGTVLIWVSESGQKGGNIHGFGDAAFFCAVQLLTVSSSMTNPLTPVGKIVDVGIEAWAIFVVTAVAGSFATFFSSGDASLSASLRSWSFALPGLDVRAMELLIAWSITRWLSAVRTYGRSPYGQSACPEQPQVRRARATTFVIA